MFIIHDPHTRACLLSHNENRVIGDYHFISLGETRFTTNWPNAKEFETKEDAQKELISIIEFWGDKQRWDRLSIREIREVVVVS